MTYIPARTSEYLGMMPESEPFQAKDLKERLGGGTLARLKNSGFIETVSMLAKIKTWRLTEKGRKRRAHGLQ